MGHSFARHVLYCPLSFPIWKQFFAPAHILESCNQSRSNFFPFFFFFPTPFCYFISFTAQSFVGLSKSCSPEVMEIKLLNDRWKIVLVGFWWFFLIFRFRHTYITRLIWRKRSSDIVAFIVYNSCCILVHASLSGTGVIFESIIHSIRTGLSSDKQKFIKTNFNLWTVNEI